MLITSFKAVFIMTMLTIASMIISSLLIKIPNSEKYICYYYDIMDNMVLNEENKDIFSWIGSYINPASYAVSFNKNLLMGMGNFEKLCKGDTCQQKYGETRDILECSKDDNCKVIPPIGPDKKCYAIPDESNCNNNRNSTRCNASENCIWSKQCESIDQYIYRGKLYGDICKLKYGKGNCPDDKCKLIDDKCYDIPDEANCKNNKEKDSCNATDNCIWLRGGGLFGSGSKCHNINEEITNKNNSACNKIDIDNCDKLSPMCYIEEVKNDDGSIDQTCTFLKGDNLSKVSPNVYLTKECGDLKQDYCIEYNNKKCLWWNDKCIDREETPPDCTEIKIDGDRLENKDTREEEMLKCSKHVKGGNYNNNKALCRVYRDGKKIEYSTLFGKWQGGYGSGEKFGDYDKQNKWPSDGKGPGESNYTCENNY